jgi:hydroxymethylpyrimidine kinase/phosphomethylpyrimidine kinase/thiamine-phosphate diphosphorylase
VLCIGGNDPAGLAGLQMDCRSCESLGVHAATAVTANTVQDNNGLYALHPVPAPALAAQIDAALSLRPAVVKIGLLGSRQQIDMLAQKLPATGLPVVLDTVLATTSAGEVLDDDGRKALLDQLVPLATVLTPNLPEAAALLGRSVESADGAGAAAALRDRGAEWVVVKGGHGHSGIVADACAGPGHAFNLEQARVNSDHLRGTGCAFASLIAAGMALGHDTRDALVIARMALQAGIVAATAVNGERGCPRPSGFPADHWPRYSGADLALPREPFAPCVGGDQPATLGLYPIVDRAAWLERLLPLGVTTVQLRIKDLHGAALAAEVEHAVSVARRHNARLFINDHWRLAIDQRAYGVHLGQEDLATADLEAIRAAGLRLGISNHCHWEVARALAVRPSYIATGPVFATTTKAMPWVPHGIEGLRYWTRAIGGYPLVAIAGINDANIGDIAATGVSGIALITAITDAADPEDVTRQLLARIVEEQPGAQ